MEQEVMMMTIGQDTSIASTSWMEHKILEHVKQALRVTLDWKAPVVSMPRKLSSLQFTMKSFRRHLERVMSIEEEDGYLEFIADSKPNMQTRIDSLASDHGRFRARIRRLVPELDELSDWEEDRFHDLCGEIRRLLRDVDHHDALEIDLLQESFLMDEGGEG
jgi:Hemerythrin HHE cation binding domain